MAIQAAIIGCGRPKTAQRPWGSQGQLHAAGLRAAGAQLAAVSDISTENMDAFRAEHGGERAYLDHREMLASEKLDLVCICTWPGLHHPMVLDCARAGVRAIHCEKPMAPTYGEAKEMVEVCENLGVQLTFNHQRRFGGAFGSARDVLRAGEIGELHRIEAMCDNLFDWGTHWFDMFFFYNGETPAQWVLGQIEWRNSGQVFGAPIEDQGLSHIRFENGVHALLMTGFESKDEYGAANRLIGTRGIIEVAPRAGNAKGQTDLVRVTNAQGVREIDTGANLGESGAVTRGIADLLDALETRSETGREPELSGRRALRATELIFATYESSRRRGRVVLPLDTNDSALQALIDSTGAV